MCFFVGAVYLRLLRGGEGAAFRVKPDVGAKARAFEGCEGDVDQQRLADGEIREGAKTAFFPDARGGIDFEDGGFRVGFLVGERDAGDCDISLVKIHQVEAPLALLALLETEVVFKQEGRTETAFDW